MRRAFLLPHSAGVCSCQNKIRGSFDSAVANRARSAQDDGRVRSNCLKLPWQG